MNLVLAAVSAALAAASPTPDASLAGAWSTTSIVEYSTCDEIPIGRKTTTSSWIDGRTGRLFVRGRGLGPHRRMTPTASFTDTPAEALTIVVVDGNIVMEVPDWHARFGSLGDTVELRRLDANTLTGRRVQDPRPAWLHFDREAMSYGLRYEKPPCIVIRQLRLRRAPADMAARWPLVTGQVLARQGEPNAVRDAAVDALFADNFGALAACYRTARKRNAAVRGDVAIDLQFTAKRGGAFIVLRTNATGDRALGKCLVAAVQAAPVIDVEGKFALYTKTLSFSTGDPFATPTPPGSCALLLTCCDAHASLSARHANACKSHRGRMTRGLSSGAQESYGAWCREMLGKLATTPAAPAVCK